MAFKKSVSTETFYRNIGKEFREIRISFSATQKEVAKYLGITTLQYSKYEKGSAQMPLHRFIRLCQYYSLSPLFFIEKVHIKEY